MRCWSACALLLTRLIHSIFGESDTTTIVTIHVNWSNTLLESRLVHPSIDLPKSSLYCLLKGPQAAYRRFRECQIHAVPGFFVTKPHDLRSFYAIVVCKCSNVLSSYDADATSVIYTPCYPAIHSKMLVGLNTLPKVDRELARGRQISEMVVSFQLQLHAKTILCLKYQPEALSKHDLSRNSHKLTWGGYCSVGCAAVYE